jgi:hypothetical protein
MPVLCLGDLRSGSVWLGQETGHNALCLGPPLFAAVPETGHNSPRKRGGFTSKQRRTSTQTRIRA